MEIVAKKPKSYRKELQPQAVSLVDVRRIVREVGDKFGIVNYVHIDVNRLMARLKAQAKSEGIDL